MEPKDRILQGAEELFFKYGIKSITMDDIAKYLSISKKTIYQFYSHKNDVVETLLKNKLHHEEAICKKMQSESDNIIVEIFSIMKHMSTLFTRINPNLFYDLQKYYPKSWNDFKKFKEECISKMVEDSLNTGIKQGLVRPDINTKIIATLRMAEMEMGFNSEIFSPNTFKMAEVQLASLDYFLHGICTIKGHKLINKYKEIIEED
ncbi:MAG: TetR/AcrR family transcriptional regulator [Bacteroidia bacterium]